MISKTISVDDFGYEILIGLSGVSSSALYLNPLTLREIFSPSECALVGRISILGKQYCEIKKFIEDTTCNDLKQTSSGLYLVSFAEHLWQSLGPYRKQLKSMESASPTLQTIYSRIYEYSDILNGLSCVIQDVIRNKIRGVLILETLYQHLTANFGVIHVALKYIYNKVCQLFFSQLQCWLLYGEITDSRSEFFIQRKGSLEGLSPFEAFSLVHSLIPSFIRPVLAQKILNLGQTVLFLRSRPNSASLREFSHAIDSTGVVGKKAEEVAQELRAVSSTDTWLQWMQVERIVDGVAAIATTELHTLATRDAHLLQQLHMVKDLFLMGRGELFHEFLVQSDWKKCHVSSLRDLNLVLRSCARKVLISEESLEPFTLQLEKMETGSQVSIQYAVPWPLQLVFTPQVIDSYNRVFRFLLRLKSVHVKMVNTWLQDKTKRKVTYGVKRRQLQQNLWFLVNNLQYYLQVDVLDSQFVGLVSAIERSKDFDEIRSAHNNFLANLVTQSFLDVDQEGAAPINPVHLRMNNLLKLCEDHCSQVEDLEDQELPEKEVDELSLKFEAWFEELFMLLASLKKHAGHPCSQHLGQLLLRLDFNQFFSSKISPASNGDFSVW